MAQGPNGGAGGSATMQRNTTMMTNQMNNQYRYQTQTKAMVMQGEGDKYQYQHKNAYQYEHKNANGVTDTVTTAE